MSIGYTCRGLYIRTTGIWPSLDGGMTILTIEEDENEDIHCWKHGYVGQ